MSSGGYSVVPVQKAFMFLRIIQVVFGLIVMGMAAYIVSLTTGFNYVFTPGALGIFTAIATLIFVVYWFVANSVSGRSLYNYWAFLAVEFFVWVFWLTTFALYASYVSGTLNSLTSYDGSYSGSSSGGGTYCYAGYCVSYKRSLLKRYVVNDPVSATIYSALAFSVLNFVLFSITLTLYAINMFRHRASLAQAEANGTTHVEHGTTVIELKA